MNVDSPSDSPNNTCKVQSKYFTSEGGMDESLLDFQEKKAFGKPKNSEVKNVVTKAKVKRTRKIKGQKDIRTALKGKKNELIVYSNKFDKVCLESGIDIDPEQLQLAIALSKSLQSESQEISQNTKPLTSQERSGKIRTTLREYGFVVPDTNIAAVRNRKVKKYRRDYKLLQTSEEEKQQIIANKYSQVLFNNFESFNKTEIFKPVENSSNIYHIVTNILYEHLKDNSIFYKINLVQKTPKIGNLLRDWTDIPGRPASPVLEVEKLEFDRIDCSQEELDSILSGTIKTAQEISKNKYNLLTQVTSDDHIDENRENSIKMDTECLEIVDLDDKKINNMVTGNQNVIIETKTIDLTEAEDSNYLTVTQNARSFSPDIFGDDEMSAVMDNSEHHIDEVISSKNTFKVCCEVMDLTESVRTTSQKFTGKSNSQLSQGFDATKRKSNDFMEMTECVVGSSQPIRENVILEENVHLIENSNNAGDNTVGEHFKVKKNDLVSMDLTQTSESSEDLPAVHISGKESIDATIILNEDVYAELYNDKNNKTKDLQKDTSDTNCSEANAECVDKRSCCLSPIKIQGSLSKKLPITIDSEDETNSPLNENFSHLNKKHNKSNKKVYELDTNQLDSESDKINNSDLSPIKTSSLSGNKLSITIDSEDESSGTNSHINKVGNNFRRLCSNIEKVINYDLDTEALDSENHQHIHSYLSPIRMFSPSVRPHIEDKTSTHKIECNNIKRVISPIEKVINYNLDTELVHTVSENKECSKERGGLFTNKLKSAAEYTESSTKSKTESFFEEFVHDHSSEEHAQVLCLDDSSNSVTNENLDRKNDIDIDLTQNTDSSVEVQGAVTSEESPKVSFDTSNLGKIGNVSIDYDDMFDDIVQTSASTSKSKSISSRSQIPDLNPDNLETPAHSDLVSNSSQNSEVFEISDKELDYSLHKSRLDIENPHDNVDFGGISVVDDLPDLPSFRPSTDYIGNRSLNRSMSDLQPVNIKMGKNSQTIKSPTKPCAVSPTSCKSTGIVAIAKTPKNGEYIVKTDAVTPMLDYEVMSTPEVHAELDKYGLKPFKRKRAIQLLTHLYNQTHPIVESCSQEASPSKRRKPNTSPFTPKISTMYRTVKSPKKRIAQSNNEIYKENENIYEVTTNEPVLRSIECSEDDWVFQKREKAKVHSCRVPLHIAFHNYVSARLRLREAILRYDPVNIDDIHKGLVAYGYRYDPKDLLKFMDKKCITVKTADNTKNKKHY